MRSVKKPETYDAIIIGSGMTGGWAAKELTEKGLRVLVLEAGRPIALIEIIPGPSHLLIENIAVLPDRHGEGIGGVLLEHAETIARSHGVNELRLYTNAKFSTNLAFYAHRGFSEFLREPHAAGGEIVHTKKLVEG